MHVYIDIGIPAYIYTCIKIYVDLHIAIEMCACHMCMYMFEPQASVPREALVETYRAKVNLPAAKGTTPIISHKRRGLNQVAVHLIPFFVGIKHD